MNHTHIDGKQRKEMNESFAKLMKECGVEKITVNYIPKDSLFAYKVFLYTFLTSISVFAITFILCLIGLPLAVLLFLSFGLAFFTGLVSLFYNMESNTKRLSTDSIYWDNLTSALDAGISFRKIKAALEREAKIVKKNRSCSDNDYEQALEYIPEKIGEKRRKIEAEVDKRVQEELKRYGISDYPAVSN